MSKDDLLHWRRRRHTAHTRETVREVRAETLPQEVLDLMAQMTDRIKMLEARLSRFETALVEAAQEHDLRKPSL